MCPEKTASECGVREKPIQPLLLKVARKVEESQYGRFGWITDPEGHRIELWEPPKTYRAPERPNEME